MAQVQNMTFQYEIHIGYLFYNECGRNKTKKKILEVTRSLIMFS